MKGKINIFLFISVFLFSVVGLTGCSKSGRNNKTNKGPKPKYSNKSQTLIKMEKVGGVYEVPIEINDTEMYFIFDTGASLISISTTEVLYLYKHGKLDDNDFIGTSTFIDAKGEISEGTIINLRKVKIGNKILTNIQASVVHNLEAPLLLGQSVLEKFGKVTIDYKSNTITLE